MDKNKYFYNLIDKLKKELSLEKEEWIELIKNRNEEIDEYIFQKAREVQQIHYGNKVYIRGLIEITNYCKNDCYYCGIRASNTKANRYRLTKKEILECCETGYELGFRTFVLQGGEDNYFSENIMSDIIYSIKKKYPDCAVTLSLGEHSYETYKTFFDSGADRFLLRHETFNEEHYGKLHPKNMSGSNRKECLKNLKKIGYQVGTGIMVGSPYQTIENIADDLVFMEKLNPQMVGIGPYITHKDTPFKNEKTGPLELTLFLLSAIRLLLPKVLLPASTALGSIHTKGRELGILSGANVVMPNLSPYNVREKYSLYNNKLYTGAEASENLNNLKENMKKIGYEIVVDRGDSKNNN